MIENESEQEKKLPAHASYGPTFCAKMFMAFNNAVAMGALVIEDDNRKSLTIIMDNRICFFAQVVGNRWVMA
jgi:hypothetical protein